MRQDRQLIVLTHLSQLITLLTGFGSLILPLILWTTQKEKVYQMDAHGKILSIFIFVIWPLFYLYSLYILWGNWRNAQTR